MSGFRNSYKTQLKINIELLFKPAMPFRAYAQEQGKQGLKRVCTPVDSNIFSRAKRWRQAKRPPMGGG